jgi:ABC-type sugar transport system ATPase subunit
MTVAENLSLGLGFPRRGGLINWKQVSLQAEEALERVGGGISPKTRINRLSRTERSLVAIARALAANAELLVLDEPTSSLTAADGGRSGIIRSRRTAERRSASGRSSRQFCFTSSGNGRRGRICFLKPAS